MIYFVKKLNPSVTGKLLTWLSNHSVFFSLTVHSSMRLSPSGLEFLDKFKDFQTKVEKKNIVIHGHVTDFYDTSYYYRFNSNSKEVLTRNMPSFYELLQFDYPEDITFYRSDLIPVFTTIAHEQIAFLDISATEADDIKHQIDDIEMTLEL